MVRSNSAATSAWTRPRDMYLSSVIEILAWPSWSAPTRAAADQIGHRLAKAVTGDLRDAQLVADLAPLLVEVVGSRHVAADDGKIITLAPSCGWS
jgi:hypothetical protein